MSRVDDELERLYPSIKKSSGNSFDRALEALPASGNSFDRALEELVPSAPHTTEEPASSMGMIHNAFQDISNVASGFAQLPAAIGHAVMNPQDIPRMGAAAWQGIKQDVGEWVDDPLKRMYEKPFSSLLDVATVLDLPAALAKGGAGIAGKVGATGARDALLKVGTAAEKITLPGMIGAGRKALPGFLEGIPESKYSGLEVLYKDLRKAPNEKALTAQTQQIVSRGTAEHIFDLRDPQRAAIEPLFKGMTPVEKHAVMFPVNYGYTPDEAMLKFSIPAAKKVKFEQAVQATKDYSNTYGQMLIDTGMLDAEVAEKSKWLSVATREQMLLHSDPKDISAAALSMVDNPTEFAALKAKYAGNEPAYVTHHLDHLTEMKPGQLASFFTDAQKASQANPSLSGPYAAPIFKKSGGYVAQEILGGRYQIDVEKAMIAHSDMVAKQISTENMFTKLMAVKNRDGSDAVPYIGTQAEFEKAVQAARDAGQKLPQENWQLYLHEKFSQLSSKGTEYVPFMPEGFLKMGRVTIDSVEDVMKYYMNGITKTELETLIHQNLGRTLKTGELTEFLKGFEAVGDALKGQMPTTSAMWVAQQPVYAMAAPMAKFLKAYMRPQNAYMKLFVSSPLQAWKMNVLGLSARWVVNNILGNTVFNTLDGVGGKAYGMARDKNLLQYVPPEVSRTSMTKVESQIPHLGDMSGVPFGETLRGIHDTLWGKALPPGALPGGLQQAANAVAGASRTIQKGAGYVYKVNEAVESFARNANYFQKAIDEAAKTGGKVEDVLKSWVKGSQGRENAIRGVNDTLYDYMSMSPLEKQVIRPYVPFYGFWKHASAFFLNLPFKHPLRAQGLKMLSAMGAEVQKDRWEQETGKKGVPFGQRFNTPVGKDAEGNINVARTTGWNPFSMVQTPNLGMVNPFAKVAFEQATGINSFTMKPFINERWKLTDSGIVDSTLDQENAKPYEGLWGKSSPAGPDLVSHVLRQFPIYQFGEQAIHPYKQYPSGNIFKPAPIGSEEQQKEGQQDIDLAEKIGNLWGLPFGTVKAEQIAKARMFGHKALDSAKRQAAKEK